MRSSFLTLKQPSARTTLVLIDASAGEASTTSEWPTRESAKVSFNNKIKNDVDLEKFILYLEKFIISYSIY